MALLLLTLAATSTVIGTQYVSAHGRCHGHHHGGHVSAMPSGGGRMSSGGGMPSGGGGGY